MKKLPYLFIGLLFFLVIIGKACNNIPSNVNQHKDSNSASDKSAIIDPANTAFETTEATKNSWDYFDDEDKLDNSKSYFAEIKSTNVLNFQFPYEGGSYGTLVLRKKQGRNEIILEISKGQFLPNSSDDHYVRLKFDDAKPISVSDDEPSDYRSDEIFLQSSSLLIAKLKKAKHLILDVEFYEYGRQALEFDVQGLDWKH